MKIANDIAIKIKLTNQISKPLKALEQRPEARFSQIMTLGSGALSTVGQLSSMNLCL